MEKLPFDPYDFFGYIASGLLLVVGMQLSLGFPSILGRRLTFIEIAFLILAVYVAGQLLATPAKALFEGLIVGKVLKAPSVNLFAAKAPWPGKLIFPGFFSPLPLSAQEKVKTALGTEGITLKGEELFLHVRYSSSVLANAELMRKLDTFRNKYGFSRNL